MDNKTALDILKGRIKFPIKYDVASQYILDSNNEMLLDVRGWGSLAKEYDREAAMDLQDHFGIRVVEILNSHFSPSPVSVSDEEIEQEVLKIIFIKYGGFDKNPEVANQITKLVADNVRSRLTGKSGEADRIARELATYPENSLDAWSLVDLVLAARKYVNDNPVKP